MATKSSDDQILHRALDARMLKAIEFANIAAELASMEISVDEYLVAQGYITEQQRKQLLAAATEESPEEGMTQQDISAPSQPASTKPPTTSYLSGNRKKESNSSIVNDESRYEWVEKFAQGGLGAVWRARDASMDRRVALKEILPKANQDPATVERFLEEARITGRLQHPGVVPIYDIGLNPSGCPYYIMKFVEGRTFHDAIQSHHKSSASRHQQETSRRQLLTAFVLVCRTMQYAHDQNYIHRDLKPRNIMLGDYGETLVVDWGLAMSVASKSGETVDLRVSGSSRNSGTKRTQIRTGRVVGTPAYLAPEQARGEIHAMDAKSDIYSLGSVLFEILTGKPPYAGQDSKSIINDVARGEFTEPRTGDRRVPAPLNSICVKAMQFEKKNRYQTAQDLAEDVERFIAGDRVLAHDESYLERAQRIVSKNSKAVLAALTGLVLLTCVICIASSLINNARVKEQKAREAAVAARDAERLALQKAEIAKNEAINNLRSAIDSVDTWLLQLSADLEFYPGLSEKRVEFLEQAADYYANLTVSDAEDTTLRSEVARAAIRNGDVNQLLNRFDEAVRNHEEAISFFRDLSQRDPRNREYQRELANALIGRAIVAIRSHVNSGAANELLDEAKQILQQLAILDSDDPRLQPAMARVSVARGRQLSAIGKLSDAIREFEDARRRLVEIVSLPQVPARYNALYHSVLFELIDLYVDTEKLRTADEVAREAIRSFDQRIQKDSLRPDHYEGRMTAWILRGNIHELRNDTDQALQYYASAQADHSQLLSVLHRGDYHSENLVAANINRARIVLQQGDIDSARRIFANCRHELSEMIQLRGQQLPLLRLFSIAAFHYSETDVALGDFEHASQGFREAVMVLDHLVTQQSDDTESWFRLAKANRELAKLGAIERNYRQAKEYMDHADVAATKLAEDRRDALALRLCRDLIERVAQGWHDGTVGARDIEAFVASVAPSQVEALRPLWDELISKSKKQDWKSLMPADTSKSE